MQQSVNTERARCDEPRTTQYFISYSNISLYPTEYAIYVFFQTAFFKVYLATYMYSLFGLNPVYSYPICELNSQTHQWFLQPISTLLNAVEDDDSDCVVIGDGDDDDNDDSGGGEDDGDDL